jgi:aspartate/methionine/tyrosine aminotransferase
MNRNLLSVRPHPSKQISDALAGDSEVVNLTVGEPSYGPPARLLEAIRERISLGAEDPAPAYNRYAHSRGVPALRRAIGEYYRRRYGLAVDPDQQVVVTHGGAEAIWLTVFTLTEPGDEVLIPDPCYMIFEPITTVLGRTAVRVPTRAENRFRLDPDDLAGFLTEKSRLLILNSPENPTGTVYDRDTLQVLVDMAHDRGFHLLHDEVFDSLLYAGEHVPAMALEAASDRVVMVNSFSKRFGMTGWRLGWLAASPEVAGYAAKAHTFMTLATGSLIQEAAAVALNDPASDREVERHRLELQEKTLWFIDELLRIAGFSLPGGAPSGGFYLFPCVTDLGARLMPGGGDGSVSEAVARHLLQDAKVAVVPGTGFGARGEGHVRISLAAPRDRLEAALVRLRDASRRLG